MFGYVADGLGGVDYLSGIELIIGTEFDDVVSFSGDANEIFWSRDFPLELLGGEEQDLGDRLDFSAVTSNGGLNVEFHSDDVIEITHSLNFDSIWAENFEMVVGSQGDDTFNGNEDINILDGSAGADQIFGGGGDDIIFFDTEDTQVEGGAGYDRAEASGPEGVVFDDGTHGIEWLQGGSANDLLTSSSVSWVSGLTRQSAPADAEVYLELTAASWDWDREFSNSSGEHYFATNGTTRVIDYSGYNIVRGMEGNDTLVSSSTYDTMAHGRTLLMGGTGNDEYRIEAEQKVWGTFGPDFTHVTEIYDADGAGRIMIGSLEFSGTILEGSFNSYDESLRYGENSYGWIYTDLIPGSMLSNHTGYTIIGYFLGHDLWVSIGDFHEQLNSEDDTWTEFVIRDFRVGDFGIGFNNFGTDELYTDDPENFIRSDKLVSIEDVTIL